MRRIFALAVATIAIASTPALAQQVAVPGVYNTGVGTGGSVLATGSDPHWMVIAPGAPASSASPAVVAYNNAWIAPGSGSAYVGDASGGSVGIYQFLTTFDLAGYDPATAILTGSLSVDDNAHIFLNGTDIGTANGFSGFTAFGGSNTSGLFNAGLNTLMIADSNSGGPFGIDVTALTVQASHPSDSAVPEPASWAMMILGLGAIGIALRRHNSAVPQLA